MLHKRHNTVITLAILLTLVGVSKPAKAFLLAQSNATPTTFTVPDRLAEDAEVSIVASNSTDSITNSLTDGFNAKYPQAEVTLETQESDAAIASVRAGEVDLAAIGRNLTEQEKAQGLIAVPISREKIAIVVSNANPYDGNLTIGQFAQIFRGEITDWSEIGGAPGAIKLVDMPADNDTRQAFPNYPVFQEAEFRTGSTAIQVEEDSTDAMAAELGENGIGYAVANDVIDRDDVKIVTMHQTQPDDPRYPFSQPFNLVYQGTPSEAAQAYLGYANTEGGQQVVANRVGSISTATVAAIAGGAGVASNLDPDLDTDVDAVDPDLDADVDASVADADLDTDVEAVDPDLDADVDAGVADADLDTDVEAVDPDAAVDTDLDADVDASVADTDLDTDVDALDPDIAADADLDTDVDASVDDTDLNADVDALDSENADSVANAEIDVDGEDNAAVNSDLDDSGELNPDLDGSGVVDSDLDGSGELNPDLDGSGVVDSDLDGSGELNPDLDGSGDPLTVDGVDGEVVVPNDIEGTEVAEKKGRWWLWLLPLLVIPLAIGAKALLGGGKSDREPAVDNVPNVNPPNGGVGVAGTPGGGVPPVGANISSSVGTAVEGARTSGIGAAGLAAGGAAIAGGAALAGRKNRVENTVDTELDPNLDLDPDLDLEGTSTIEEIPSNPVSEFTSQDTKLQIGDQDTKLQIDEDIDIDDVDTDLGDGFSPSNAAIATGMTGLGGAAIAGYTGDRTESISEDLDELDLEQNDNSAELNTEINNLTESDLSEAASDTATSGETVGREFLGDYVLQEETSTVINNTAELDTDINIEEATIADDLTPDADLNADAVSAEIDTSVDVPSSEQDTDLDFDTINPDFPTLETPSTAEINSGSVATPEVDLDVDAANVERPEPNTDSGIVDRINSTGGATIAGGAAVLGGAAAAASGMFNRGRDSIDDVVEDTTIDVPSSEQDTDIDFDTINPDFPTLETPATTEVDTSVETNTSVYVPSSESDTDIDFDTINPDFPTLETPATTEVDTSVETDTSVYVPSSESDTDFDTINPDFPTLEAPATAEINSGSVATPEVDLDVDVADVERPEHSTDSGIVDRINSTGGAAIAGGAAALGGAAAAASGMFNRERDSIDDVVEDTSVDVPSSESDTDTDTDFDTINADFPTLETPATTEVDASVETDTSVYVPSSETDTDSDLDTVNADLPTLETPSTAEVDTSVDVPSSETDTDLDLDTINADLPTLETPSTVEINSGSVATPEVDLDVDVADVDRPEPSTDSGIVDRINSTGGAAIAGGAAALGGAAAAASGMFNRERDSIDDVVEDTSTDVPSSESETDTDTDTDTVNADLPTLETPATAEVDTSVETDTSSETDTDTDTDTVNAELPTLETPATAEVDTSVETDTSIDVPSSETETDLDLDTVNADLPTLETPATAEVDTSVETDTSIDVPSLEIDTDLDSIGTINGDITGAETETTTDSDILVEIDTGIDTSDEIDTGIDVLTLDLDSDQDLIADDAVDEISGAVVTPEVADINSDTVTIDSPSTDVDSSITDDANPTGGAAIAGGAAILGGAAAAASGIFNRENDTVDDAEDISIDVPSSEPELDFNLDDIDVEAIDTEEAAANVDNLDTSVEVIDLRQDATFQNNELIDDLAADPNLDTASDTSANVLDLRQDDAEQSLEEDTDADIAGEFFDDVTNGINRGGVEIAGSAAALGGDASELLDRDTEDTSSATPTPTSFDFQEFETFETSFDLAVDTQDDNFADNIVADAETTSIDDDNDLSEITLDSVTNAADLNLDELTLDNVEQNVSSSLEEITFDDLDAAELSSDDISLENADDKINANLDEITFDSDRTIDYSLEEITFDDVEANSNFDLNDIANAEDTEIRLDDLGFEELDSTNDDFKLLENNTAEIASASDDESNDMNNISEWLDSLEAPKQDNESIVNWLDTLDKDSVRNSNSESNRQDKELSVDLNEEADDISFEFLEDLLDRDANSNREN